MQSPNLVATSAYPCRWLFSHHGGKEKMNDEKKKTRVLCEVRFTRKSKIIEEFWGPLCQNRGERKHAPTNFTKCGGSDPRGWTVRGPDYSGNDGVVMCCRDSREAHIGTRFQICTRSSWPPIDIRSSVRCPLLLVVTHHLKPR